MSHTGSCIASFFYTTEQVPTFFSTLIHWRPLHLVHHWQSFRKLCGNSSTSVIAKDIQTMRIQFYTNGHHGFKHMEFHNLIKNKTKLIAIIRLGTFRFWAILFLKKDKSNLKKVLNHVHSLIPTNAQVNRNHQLLLERNMGCSKS